MNPKNSIIVNVLSFDKFIKQAVSMNTIATIVLFVLDKKMEETTLMPVIKRVLDIGGEYFLSYGINADPVHDLFDDVILAEQFSKYGSNYDPPLDQVVMTTAHVNDSAEEVIFFLLNATIRKNQEYRFLILHNEKGTFIDEIKKAAEGMGLLIQ